MKNSVSLICFMVLLSTYMAAQTNTYASAKDSDPKSVAVLNNIKKKYSSTTGRITSTFTLKMEFPGQTARLESGTMIQEGKKFNLDIKDMAVINDGKTVWFINKKLKEVQINDQSSDGDQGLLNPADFLAKYDPKNFVTALTFDGVKSGKQIQVIECKPVQKNTEYSKARITVNKATGELAVLEVFNKDGSRHHLQVSKTVFGKPGSADTFTFSKAKYPSFHVEDLRVN